jgi:hypothetical protein
MQGRSGGKDATYIDPHTYMSINVQFGSTFLGRENCSLAARG